MTMFNKVSKTFQWGRHTVTLETGEIARQASGAVMVTMDDTMVLATVVGAKNAKPGQDFFPLTVDYTEKTYAAGKIPGSFFKREGRPSELETLTCRLIDRPLRPLFPDGFYNEVQIIVHVMSLNPEVSADIPALIGASAALAISGIPFNGPIGAARVGYVNGEYVLNPGKTELTGSKLDLVVAGTEAAVLMVESEADQLSEEVMLGAVVFGHDQGKIAIAAINDLVRDAGKAAWDWQPPAKDEAFIAKVNALAEEPLRAAYQIRSKQARTQACRQAYAAAKDALKAEGAAFDEVKLEALLFDIEARIVRSQILAGEPRIDGRDTRTVRQIEIRNSVLPRAHGSSLFTRGETQALVAATLGTARDAQRIDALAGEFTDRFMLHYNMPPFATGEAGRFGSPKRREIGHGRLAKRALAAALPSESDFPYTLRLVSEITESNGSSSMASVCGSTLALLDAGVPITRPVAGIAMGLIKEGDDYIVLSDIQGDEDHLGDMDFKVAGTSEGINALQMDIKITGVTFDILRDALAQAKAGREHILGIMSGTLAEPRSELSAWAPRITAIKIDPERIGTVIGKGGETIRGLEADYEVEISIEDDGTVKVYGVNGERADAAVEQIRAMTKDVEVGDTYTGAKVVKTTTFGAFVELTKGVDGLLHISNLGRGRVDKVEDVINRGDTVDVTVVEVDKARGRIGLRIVGMEDVDGGGGNGGGSDEGEGEGGQPRRRRRRLTAAE